MNAALPAWALSRAYIAVEQMRERRQLRGRLTIADQESLVAAALVALVEDCAEVCEKRAAREEYGHAKAACFLDAEAIRAEFPKGVA